MLQAVGSATAGVLNVTGAAGVPFVGIAGILLQDILQTCDEVKVYKKKSRQIANNCAQLLNLVNEQTSNLEGTEMQQITDQLVSTLDRIYRRMKLYSSYSAIMTFCKHLEIRDGLEMSNNELEGAMKVFNVHSNVTLHATQNHIMQAMDRQKSEIADLVYHLLTEQSQRQQVVELQQSGEHVAEQIMEAGQEELRTLRELDVNTQSSSLDSVPTVNDSQRYLQYQRGLIKLHRETGIPPTIKILNGEIARVGEPVAGGAFSDIWVGMWLGEEKVALKALRNVKAADSRAKRRFENEIKIWAEFKNTHILPFYGIVTDLGQYIHMVSPWQENGNVLEYVKREIGADRLLLIRGAAQGLDYLHSKNVIHGNVKCANILVTKDGEACICDFGMAKVIEEVTETSASTTLTMDGGSARWLAPELIEGRSASKEADTYSYAMAILELLTEKQPYAEIRKDAAVIRGIVLHNLAPTRPEDVSDALWLIMQRCWHRKISDRPTMHEVASLLLDKGGLASLRHHSNSMPRAARARHYRNPV